MKFVKVIYVLCIAVLLNNYQAAGILAQQKDSGTDRKSASVESASKLPAENVTATNLPASPDKSFFANSSNERYVIGFQDTLEILISKHPELSQVVNVSPDGTILMPKIDKPILAACKTEAELREHITTLYKSYLRNPFVNVRVSDQKSQPIGVIGAVEKPGNFFLNRKIRLLEAIALAGGQDVEHEGGNIVVTRFGTSSGCGVNLDSAKTEDEKIKFFEYKMEDVTQGKQNPWVEPGDIVSIAVSKEAYVTGNVVEPKKIPLRETVTLTKAIAMAGGLAKEAKTSRVRIQRQGKEGELQTETLYDLKDIQSKKIPDPVLQANDIVDVPNDSVKSIRNGLLKALSNGLPSILLRMP